MVTKNQRYNAERKAQAELMKRDLDRDKLLTQIYQESYDRLQRQIDGFYIRYAGKEGLSKAEAIKRASDMDVTKFATKARQAVREKDFSQATNGWLRTYNLKMKVSRMELLKAELALEIQNLTAEVNEVFDRARADEYLNEYKRQAGVLGISSAGAKKRMQSILDADFYGQTFSSRVWGGTGLQAVLQRDVFSSLGRIFTDMMGYKQEMARLAKKYGTSKSNAKRLLKTEIARINADTQLAMLKDNDFTHLIYVAEASACDVCASLDGRAIPIDKAEKGLNMYPMHPNCRCSSYGHIKLDRKDGTSTLDGHEVWGDDEKSDKAKSEPESNGSSHDSLPLIEGSRQSRLEDAPRGTVIELFSDVDSIWESIIDGNLSRQQIASKLKSSYYLGDFPVELSKILGKSSVVIDRASLSHSLSKHAGQYSLDEFRMIEEMIANPELVLDNSDRLPNSAILYKSIPDKTKVLLEGIVRPSDDLLLFHFSKVGIRQKKKNQSKNETLYLSDD